MFSNSVGIVKNVMRVDSSLLKTRRITCSKFMFLYIGLSLFLASILCTTSTIPHVHHNCIFNYCIKFHFSLSGYAVLYFVFTILMAILEDLSSEQKMAHSPVRWSPHEIPVGTILLSLIFFRLLQDCPKHCFSQVYNKLSYLPDYVDIRLICGYESWLAKVMSHILARLR